MSIASKVHALLTSLSPTDIEALPPVQRRRFADLCRHVASLAERAEPEAKAGVLARLSQGERAP